MAIDFVVGVRDVAASSVTSGVWVVPLVRTRK